MGSPSARSIPRCAKRRPSAARPAVHIDWLTVKIGTPRPDRPSVRAAGCTPTQSARFPVAGMEDQRRHQAGHADRQRHCVSGGAAELTKSSKPVSAMLPATRTVFTHSKVRGRCASTPGPGHHLATGQRPFGPFPAGARARISRIAPCPGAHVPAESRAQVTGDFDMLGDQRRVSSSQSGGVVRSRWPVADAVDAIGLQLCFVGHRPDERVVEGVLGMRGEPDLIDDFGSDQLASSAPPSSNASCRHQIATRSPPQHSEFVWQRGRAGRYGRRWWPAGSPARRYRHDRPAGIITRAPVSTARSARSRTISSAKNGLPAARSAITVANPPTEGIRPEQLGCSAAVSESLTGPRAMLCDRASGSARLGIRGGS